LLLHCPNPSTFGSRQDPVLHILAPVRFALPGSSTTDFGVDPVTVRVAFMLPNASLRKHHIS
jgi:hypothetical protein